jgi:peroxiredoxin
MKSGSVAQIAFIVFAALAVYGFVGAAQKDQRRTTCSALCAFGPAYAGRNRMAPDFELKDMNGAPVKLSSFRGKTVFLNFWTKTCAPCLEEMASIAELARVVKNRTDMVVLTVSTDQGPDDVRDTLKVTLNGDAPFPVLFDPESKIVLEQYGTKLFPETWIIDPKGVIRARVDGARDWSSSLVMEIGEMVQKPGGCPVEFFKSLPRGQYAGVCEDDG